MDYILPILVNLAILSLIWFAGADWLRRNQALRPLRGGHGEGHAASRH